MGAFEGVTVSEHEVAGEFAEGFGPYGFVVAADRVADSAMITFTITSGHDDVEGVGMTLEVLQDGEWVLSFAPVPVRRDDGKTKLRVLPGGGGGSAA